MKFYYVLLWTCMPLFPQRSSKDSNIRGFSSMIDCLNFLHNKISISATKNILSVSACAFYPLMYSSSYIIHLTKLHFCLPVIKAGNLDVVLGSSFSIILTTQKLPKYKILSKEMEQYLDFRSNQ